jgi:acetyl-CoA decarbonylase/synthase complex subunit delta
MERIRMAALTQEDDKLQIAMINNLGNEIWKCKEAGETIDDAPAMGDPERRAILMEVVGAVCYLAAGSDVLILRHPESVRIVRSYIDLMVNGGSAADVTGISKNLPLEEADLLALSPEPTLDFEAVETLKAEPKKETKKEAPKPKAEKKEAPAEPAGKEKKAPAKEEKVVELKPKAEEAPKAAEEAKAEAEAKAKAEAEAKAKAEAETKAKAEAEAKAKAEAEAKAKAEAEAKAKAAAEAEAKAKVAAKAREKEELLALRQKRAQERAELEAKRAAGEGGAKPKTAAAEQLSLVDKLILNLQRVHKHS